MKSEKPWTPFLFLTLLVPVLVTTMALANDAERFLDAGQHEASGRGRSAEGAPARPSDRPADHESVERGRYLVAGFGCSDCHSPWILGPAGPQPDPERFLSGHPADVTLPPAPGASGPWAISVAATNTAWSGPWGTSFTANLTPDVETGLGSWSVEDFVAALRTGRHQGRGREILPPMPWPAIRNLSDDDLRSIFHYLRTIPAIENRVPNPLPPATH